MRVTIIHNPDAGDQYPAEADIVDSVQSSGHSAGYAPTTDPAAVDRALAHPGDLVLVAGGDGTVRRIGCRLIGRGVPMTIVPCGTANNVATSLGVRGDVHDLVGDWPNWAPLAFDVGRLSGDSGEQTFFEAGGIGSLAASIAALQQISGKESDHLTPEEELGRDLKVLREILADQPTRECRLSLDGEDVSGKYLVIEAMNLPLVGPGVRLAPDADPADGWFDVVLVTDRDRVKLRDYLCDRLEGGDHRLALPTRRAREVRLVWEGSRVHADDQIWPGEEEAVSRRLWSGPFSASIELRLHPGALSLLVPPQRRRPSP